MDIQQVKTKYCIDEQFFGKIRDAVKTYSRLLEQKGKGAISVR